MARPGLGIVAGTHGSAGAMAGWLGVGLVALAVAVALARRMSASSVRT